MIAMATSGSKRRKAGRAWPPLPSPQFVRDKPRQQALDVEGIVLEDRLGPRLEWLRRARPAQTGERSLLLAVLEQGVEDLRKGRYPEAPANLRVRADEARCWAISNDRRWLFAFVPLCEALGIDPDYLRRGLGIGKAK